MYGVCACTACNCSSKAEDSTYENETNAGLVVDSTEDCESCQ